MRTGRGSIASALPASSSWSKVSVSEYKSYGTLYWVHSVLVSRRLGTIGAVMRSCTSWFTPAASAVSSRLVVIDDFCGNHPLVATETVGYYYTMCAAPTPGRAYVSSGRHIALRDFGSGERDTWCTFSLAEALESCCRFDDEGNLWFPPGFSFPATTLFSRKTACPPTLLAS